MEYTDLFGEGDVDVHGQIVTPAEGLQWCARALQALGDRERTMPPDCKMEYSAWLVSEHEKWIEAQRGKLAA